MKFFLKKHPKNLLNNRKKNNLRSQIAVIITLVIAFIILLTVVFINIFKVSTIKTTTSQAADKAALTLASQIGSLSKTYWDALHAGDLNNPSEEMCSFDWFELVKLAVAAIAVAFLAAWFAAPLILLMGIGVFVSGTVMSGITTGFQNMSVYNSLRETALFQAVSMVQTDTVEVKNSDPSQGKFLIPITSDQTVEYILKGNPGCGPACWAVPKIGRFAAWYYEKRQKLVNDEVLKIAVNGFIDGVFGGFRDGLRKFVEIDSWDPLRWKITGLSYILAGVRSGYVGQFTVTCGDSCPEWVVPNVNKDLLRLIRIKPDAIFGPDYLYGGVLTEKFDGSLINVQLLRRLENDYGDIFCLDENWNLLCGDPIVNEKDFGTIKEDMRHLLVRIKEVLNLPLSERLKGLTLWFAAFYDPSSHDAERKNLHDTDDDGAGPDTYGTFEAGDENQYGYDIYLRLERDIYYISQWIAGLEGFDSAIISSPIASNDYGTYCPEAGDAAIALGDPRVTHTCFSGVSNCVCNHQYRVESQITELRCDGDQCINPIPARFRGNYGSCTKANNDPVHDNHPVCQSGKGDFYFSKPSWCNSRYIPPCIECPSAYCTTCVSQCCGVDSNCESCSGCGACSGGCPLPLAPVYGPGAIPTEFKYQGQLSWTPADRGQYDSQGGPTEVGQAVAILKEWRADLIKLKYIITVLQGVIEAQQDDALRNELVYVWQDKYPVAGKTATKVYGHLVRAKITDYPKELPYISERTEWWNLWKCRQIHAYKGSFEIEVSRYDTDQPSIFWNLRRRPSSSTEDEFAEYDPNVFYRMANELLNDGALSWTYGDLRVILDTLDTNGRPQYIITSKTKVHFGPKKEDIYIMSVDGGAESPP